MGCPASQLYCSSLHAVPSADFAVCLHLVPAIDSSLHKHLQLAKQRSSARLSPAGSLGQLTIS